MNDATTLLRRAYIELLSGIEIEGIKVPVYADFPNDNYSPDINRAKQPRVYILLSNQSHTDDSNKETFEAEHSIQVTVYVWYPINNGSFLLAELIDKQVKERILQTTHGRLDIPGFNCYRSRLSLSNANTEFTAKNYIFKRISIFNHSIEQQNYVNS